MKSILFIFSFCLIVRLQIGGTWHTDDQLEHIREAMKIHEEAVTKVLEIAKSTETINGVLKPFENGLLGFGGGGFVFRGLRLEDEKPVAIKFVSNDTKAEREYTSYSYLKAINVTEAENYGIPTVYYYGKWKNLTVTAYTVLDKTLNEPKGELPDYDYLFLIRHFIKQTKYMHSLGLRHDDIKPDNIVFRDCETFLIDFDHASQMKMDNGGGTLKYASLRYHQGKQRVNMDDWESFLYILCDILRIHLRWSIPKMIDAVKNDKDADIKLIEVLKTKILDKIEEDLRGDLILLDLMLSFAKEVFSGKEIPDYDGLGSKVTGLLKDHFGDQTCFSWIKPVSDQERITESIKRANTEIADLVIPKKFSDYDNFPYPPVVEDYFNKQKEPSINRLKCTDSSRVQ